MAKNLEKRGREELQAWIKQRLDAAVHELIDSGVFESVMIEAKPAWVFPFQVLLGKIREQGEEFKWIICGEVPTDYFDSATVSTPREAARHFALKWQLDAARQQNLSAETPPGPAPESRPEYFGSELAETAEALYALVNDASLWQRRSSL